MRSDLARALAAAFLAGDWTRQGLVESGASVLGRRPRWLSPLARQTVELYPRPPGDRPRELAINLASRPAAVRAVHVGPLVRPLVATQMLTNRWRLPVLEGLGDVAAFLDVEPDDLDWFSDPRRLARSAADPRLQHYRVSHRPAPSGAVRVLEAPKPRLKVIQRRLLDEVVSLIRRTTRPGGSDAAARCVPMPLPTLTGRSCCGWTSRRSSPA